MHPDSSIVHTTQFTLQFYWQAIYHAHSQIRAKECTIVEIQLYVTAMKQSVTKLHTSQ